MKETIERRVRRNQRGFENSDGFLRVCKRDRIRLAWKRPGESVMITGYAFQLLRHMRGRRRHLQRIDHRAAGLLLQIFGPPVPELRRVENRVQHGGRVPPAVLPPVTDGGRLSVRASEAEIVASVAADDMARGKTGVEIQHLAEFDLTGRRGVAGKLGRTGRDRLKLLLRPRHQVLLGHGRRREAAHEPQQGNDG